MAATSGLAIGRGPYAVCRMSTDTSKRRACPGWIHPGSLKLRGRSLGQSAAPHALGLGPDADDHTDREQLHEPVPGVYACESPAGVLVHNGADPENDREPDPQG